MSNFYFFYVYFVQAASTLVGLAQIHHLQNNLGLSMAEITIMTGIVMLPWSLKPFMGLISDFIPLLGQHRRTYGILANLCAIGGWWVIALGPSSYSFVLWALALQAFGLAFNDVICDGIVVSRSNDSNGGTLQSLCWSGNATGGILGSFLSGLALTALGIRPVFALAGFLPIITLLILFRMDEPTHVKGNFKAIILDIRNLFLKLETWVFALFLYLWNIAPQYGTPFYFYMKEELEFSDSLIGMMSAVSSLGFLAGSLLYGFYFQKLPVKRYLFFTIVIGSLGSLLTFLISDVYTSFFVHFIQGTLFILGFLPILRMVAEHAPLRIGAAAFALFASLLNLSRSHSSILGGWLIEPLGLTGLIWVAFLTSLVCLPTVPFLQSSKKAT